MRKAGAWRDALQSDGLPVPSRKAQGVRRNLDALGQSWEHPNLFAEATSVPTAAIAGMVRGDSPITSQAAAVAILPKLSQLQADVLAVADGRTDREIERMDVFARYAPSTVRKRRSELLQQGRLRAAGDRDGLTVWLVVR